jgi:hypothetical protein
MNRIAYPVLRAVLGILVLAALPVHADLITWTNTAGGDWSLASNWSPNEVPQSTDAAFITNNGTYTVTVTASESVSTLTLGGASGTQTLSLSSGSLTVGGAGTGNAQGVVNLSGGTLAGPLTLAGPFNWTGGSITGVVQCNGSGTIAPGSVMKYLYGGQLVNAGALAWSDILYSDSGSVISNLFGATINLTAGVATAQYNGGSRTIINNGTITMAGSGTSAFGDVFNNNGTVNVNGGTLNLSGGGTETGAFTATANSTNNLSNGTWGFGSGSSISGAGAFTVSGATASFTGSSSLSAASVNVTSGTLAFNGSGAITIANFNMSGGNLEGSSPAVVGGAFNWTGGSITGAVRCNGTGTVGPGAAKDLQGGQLINGGTLAWSDNIQNNSGIISNLLGATINLTAGVGTQNYGGTRTFVNNGTLTMTGAGTSAFGDVFNNNGTVSVNGGTLNLSGGGTETGAFTAANGATLNLSGGAWGFGSWGFGSGSSISGAGAFTVSGGTATFTGAATLSAATVNVNGGTLTFNGSGAITPATFNLSGGTVAGALTLGGAFNWTSGFITGAVQCNGAGTVGPGDAKYLQGGQLINGGTLAWTDTLNNSSAIISNLLGATINLTAGVGTQNYGGTRTFVNNGTLTMTGVGTSAFGDVFNNNGTVHVNGGTLNLTGTGVETGAFTAKSGTTLNLSAGAWNFNSGFSISGAGILALSGATANFNAGGSITIANCNLSAGTLAGSYPAVFGGAFNWTGGSITGAVRCNGTGTVGPGAAKDLQGGQLINGGTLAWSDNIQNNSGIISNLLGATINLTAGFATLNYGGMRTFVNNGTITMTGSGTSTFDDTFNNNGTLNIQSGAVSLTGAYSLAGSTLNFGITSPASYGSLNLSGNAALAGALGVTFTGYKPQIGDTYALVAYGSETGQFGAFNLPPAIIWQETYGSTAFTLSAVNFAAPTNVTMVVPQPAWTTIGFNLQISGPLGSNYTVQFCTNLVARNWATWTNFVSASTLTSITDSAATNFYTNRFYRAFMP